MKWPFKRKPELLKQIAYDATFAGDCPICETTTKEVIHKLQAPDFERPPKFDDKMILECPHCNNAFFGYRQYILRTLQTYEKTSDGPFGLKLIKTEGI